MSDTHKATTDDLHTIHGLLCRSFHDKLNDPEGVTSADANVIRQFLKDNGVTTVPQHDTAITQICEDLPYDGSEGNVLFIKPRKPAAVG